MTAKAWQQVGGIKPISPVTAARGACFPSPRKIRHALWNISSMELNDLVPHIPAPWFITDHTWVSKSCTKQLYGIPPHFFTFDITELRAPLADLATCSLIKFKSINSVKNNLYLSRYLYLSKMLNDDWPHVNWIFLPGIDGGLKCITPDLSVFISRCHSLDHSLQHLIISSMSISFSLRRRRRKLVYFTTKIHNNDSYATWTLQGKETSIKTSKVAVMDATWTEKKQQNKIWWKLNSALKRNM